MYCIQGHGEDIEHVMYGTFLLSNLVEVLTTIGYFKFSILPNINFNIDPIIMATH